MPLDRAKTRANADKLLRANRVQDAIRELQKLAEDNPRDIQTLNQLGNLYLRLGNKAAAVPMFLRVAELYNKSGFATKAVASLKIATREQPDHLEAWEMLANLSEQQ
jgi:predicted Zn-dependent protease